jgi:hypothetical protein
MVNGHDIEPLQSGRRVSLSVIFGGVNSIIKYGKSVETSETRSKDTSGLNLSILDHEKALRQ